LKNNLNAIILDQNLPNPFAEKTTINYNLPEEVLEAQLLFYNAGGVIIKQVTIDERGEGSLTVYGENLKNGVYTYSLIADGKLIATKRMVKTN
ncbi:MAG: T9SS type A sorting domain-containing protein, partial [Vicingaceae bacterium]